MVKIEYIGLFNNQFNYKVIVNNNNTFDYSTGIGWVYIGFNNPNRLTHIILDISDRAKLFDIDRKLERKYDLSFRNKVYRIVPTELDVLECLKLDCDAGNMSFYDFCADFGYNNDSLEALNVYRSCQETAIKLKGFNFPDFTKE